MNWRSDGEEREGGWDELERLWSTQWVMRNDGYTRELIRMISGWELNDSTTGLEDLGLGD